MPYRYKHDDMFYDVESLSNVFTVAWWLPHPDMNAIILSYLDDDGIIQGESDEDYIRQYIYNLHPRLKNTGTEIVFENIKHTGCINEYVGQNGNTHSVLGLQSFAKRMGLANQTTYLNARIDERHKEGGGLQYDPAFFPVKQTDPDYDENRQGYRFGYNSTNYDLTVLAYILSELHDQHFGCDYTNRPVQWGSNIPFTANMIRNFNDELFEDSWKSRMAMRLAHVPGSHPDSFGDFTKPGWILRKSWLLTGRYIDVARLNEKLQKVGLKRLLGMLGLQIMESEKLENDTKINNLEEFADLLAYNISDVVNLQLLFEHKVYQNAFNVRGQLLKTFPATIYGQKRGYAQNGQELPVDEGNYTNIRKDRLARDSTSAKFVEYAIAPYKPIKDIPAVSLVYPSKLEAKKLGIEQSDILEDTKKFFEENVTADPEHQAHKDFMEVYNFYDNIRGHNFNASKAYMQHYGSESMEAKNNQYIRGLMAKYNTNLFYHHKDENGNVYRSSCLANFSIGGIHGAEVNTTLYNRDLTEYQNEKAIQDYVESLYPSATDALNGPTYITLPEYFELTERVAGKIKDDGTIKIREFVKSGSTKKKAVWRDVQPVELFQKNASGNWEVKKKYTFVSVGPSHHEDFTSYYPLLLSRLSVFINPSYHGYKDNGDPADPYYELFLTRLKKKKEAKDMSLTQEQRDLAQIEQESRKLLINAASGAGDATFDNNIRANNAVISMRIIGQLFAWRIGQAQALAGARVPSTNTDGLYTMGISAEVNDRILEDIAKDMYIGIGPERLDRFVSKDSNNRLEVYDGGITSAKGGTLNSWGGPQPTQSLDHAAIIDHILAKYLADERLKNPANHAFDREHAEKMFHEFIQEHIQKDTPQEALKFFQWIVASSTGTHRYTYAKLMNKHTGETMIKNLQHYNRIFLIKEVSESVRQEVYLATRRVIDKKTWVKREKEYQNGERMRNDLWEHDEDALQILVENGLDLKAHNDNPASAHHKDEAKTQKIRTMPQNQHIGIYNQSIVDLPNETALQMIGSLDLDAYTDILAHTFRSWSNI
ncbi:hypothetical protein JUJ52_02945 [Virgibacillus sp. AGTR]|uniref:hypothetical protein n=1 Tax=Virgibacillus sp. AGTR TaxID=2812055 RepID=UPI001D166C4B|nr:hypothetical protein [Virgibacillus sp. AGTR]MCC2248914.1 hypothetical protein [Virgibacillus sp. AGTR]